MKHACQFETSNMVCSRKCPVQHEAIIFQLLTPLCDDPCRVWPTPGRAAMDQSVQSINPQPCDLSHHLVFFLLHRRHLANTTHKHRIMRDVIFGKKGQTVCIPTTWTDIAKFFAFNYGLHVFTVISAPGSGGIQTVITCIFALLMPFTGVLTALEVIFRWRPKRLDDLHTAHRAGALCMLVPDLPDLPDGFERRV